MALIECKECHADVSSKAPVCPKCGAPIKPKGGCGILSVICVIVVFVFIGWIAIKSQNMESSEAPRTPANISVRIRDLSVSVKNVGTPNWHKMTVYLNDAYKHEGPAPLVGETIEIPVMQFDRDGARFNPINLKVIKVTVEGDGIGSTSYTPRK